MDLAPQPALNRDRGDALDALEPGRQIVFTDFAKPHAVEVTFDANAHDRRGVRVELEHDGWI